MHELGDYLLETELGRGAMGVVWRARHRPTGTVRAVKVLAATIDHDRLLRFRREAETLARAGGDGVVPVHEIGFDKGRAFLAMALMPGGSLRTRLEKAGRLPWREAAAIAATIARALDRCHSEGVIHRDVKPDNVLFDELGRPRLADFGIASEVGGVSLTQTGVSLGTPVYMAPEQFAPHVPAPAIDVYALGIVLHELVTGAVPHAAVTPIELLRVKTKGERPPLPAGTPAAFDAVVACALAPNAADRFATAAELADALDAALAGKAAAGSSRRTALAGAAIAALGAAVILGALALLMPGTPPVDPKPVTPPGPPSVTQRKDDPATASRELKEAASFLRAREPIARARTRVEKAREASPSGRFPEEGSRDVVAAALERIERIADKAEHFALAAETKAAWDEALIALEIARLLAPATKLPIRAVGLACAHARAVRLTSPGSAEALEALLLAVESDPKISVELADACTGYVKVHTDPESIDRACRTADIAAAAAPRELRADALRLGVLVRCLAGRWNDMYRLAVAAVREDPSRPYTLDIMDALLLRRPDPSQVDPALLEALATAAPSCPEVTLPRALMNPGYSEDVPRCFTSGFPLPEDRARIIAAAAREPETARTVAQQILLVGRVVDAAQILAQSPSPELRAMAHKVVVATTEDRKEKVAKELAALKLSR